MQTKFADYVFKSYRKRKLKSLIICVCLVIAGVLALTPLLSILGYVIFRGFPSLNIDFFTSLPKPMGELGGGMANALLGTVTLVGLASVIGIPWGIITGVYLSEYGHGKRAMMIRFSVDLMASVPSIIVGLFVYTLVVLPMKRFSAIAGGLALAILMIPIVARVTEEILKMVSIHIREAGLALGIPRWKVILFIVLKGSRKGITTGVMLSIARISGETAPLLFTALSNRFWQSGLDQPIASLPVQIYNYAISPYDDWQRLAWTGALVLILLIFAVNLITRLILKSSFGNVRTP